MIAKCSTTQKLDFLRDRHFFCVYFNILLYVNKKINIWGEDPKKLYCVAQPHPPLQQLSHNRTFQAERKISGIS
jgi:hypothetical protein